MLHHWTSDSWCFKTTTLAWDIRNSEKTGNLNYNLLWWPRGGNYNKHGLSTMLQPLCFLHFQNPSFSRSESSLQHNVICNQIPSWTEPRIWFSEWGYICLPQTRCPRDIHKTECRTWQSFYKWLQAGANQHEYPESLNQLLLWKPQ